MNLSGNELSNVSEIDSPALLLYLDRARENVRRMIAIAGGPDRLRPHVKTHKIPELIELQKQAGIAKFKCATIAEAEMLGLSGVPDALLAYQPVGPKITRLFQLIASFPNTKFSCIADDPEIIATLSKHAASARQPLTVFLDLDCGMHRCGVPPGQKAAELYRQIHSSPGLIPGGLHAYDGHIHHPNLNERRQACDDAFAPVLNLQKQLIQQGLPVPLIIAGGTPTFPIHAARPGVECSPGTCIFWDRGYQTKLPDMDFLWAALVLTRVISKPGPNLLCLDLGHKAIAAENPHPRVYFPALPEAKATGHSEEHLVIETDRAPLFPVGTPLYGVPWHICPTVALHNEAVIVENGRAENRWKVSARNRVLTI